MLYELLYVSKVADGFTKDDMLDILKISRENNEKKGITGILLYYKDHFCQVLEGGKEDIEDLYKVIEADKRNHSTTVLCFQPVNERVFANWSMAFQDISDVDTSQLEGYSEFLEKGFTVETVSDHTSLIKDMLIRVKTIIEKREEGSSQ